jgi:hypothetical protein
VHVGTGISDGYPPGGVDAHDVRTFTLMKRFFLMNCLTVERILQATPLRCPRNWQVSAQNPSLFQINDGRTSHELYVYANTLDMYVTPFGCLCRCPNAHLGTETLFRGTREDIYLRT